MLSSLNLDVPVADVPPGPPPWLLPVSEVSYTPTSKSHLPSLQLQMALQHAETVASSVTSPFRIYRHGSFQPDGAAGGAIFSPDMEPPDRGWVGRRLHDHSSSTL